MFLSIGCRQKNLVLIQQYLNHQHQNYWSHRQQCILHQMFGELILLLKGKYHYRILSKVYHLLSLILEHLLLYL